MGTPWGPLGGAGMHCCEEGCLGSLTQSAATQYGYMMKLQLKSGLVSAKYTTLVRVRVRTMLKGRMWRRRM